LALDVQRLFYLLGRNPQLRIEQIGRAIEWNHDIVHF
jgi:hypothetical protein